MGKTVAKCINKYQGKWISPSEFETLAGVQARKWKQSIKYGGKPLGAWLSLNPLCETSPGQSDSQSVDDNGVQDTSDCSGIVEDVCHVNERQVHGVSCPNIVQSEQASICSHSANVGFPDIPSQSLNVSFESMFNEIEQKLLNSWFALL